MLAVHLVDEARHICPTDVQRYPMSAEFHVNANRRT